VSEIFSLDYGLMISKSWPHMSSTEQITSQVNGIAGRAYELCYDARLLVLPSTVTGQLYMSDMKPVTELS
jgi:hypothetical protein